MVNTKEEDENLKAMRVAAVAESFFLNINCHV